MMYLQRHIVLTTSIVTELQTMRAAMNSWLPATQTDMDTMGHLTEGGVDLDTHFTAMFAMFQNVTTEAFFQAAPTMAAAGRTRSAAASATRCSAVSTR